MAVAAAVEAVAAVTAAVTEAVTEVVEAAVAVAAAVWLSARGAASIHPSTRRNYAARSRTTRLVALDCSASSRTENRS
jgi:hypothetical protein